MKRVALFLCATLLLFGVLARDGRAGVSCSLPFNLQNNTTADATQVMANYNALVTCLGNAAAAGANSDITALLGLLTPISPSAGGSNIFIGGTSTGSALAQVVASTTPSGYSLQTGYTVIFKAGYTNTATTGNTTLNVNSQGATNVYRQSPSGPQSLTGGEMVVGQLVAATYDGTQYQLVTNGAQFGGYGPLSTLASGTTTDLGTIASHNVNVTGTTTITSFGASASTTFPMYKVAFSGVLTITYNQTNCSTTGGCINTPGSANIVTAANDTAELLYLGNGSGGGGNWQIVSYSKANGTAAVNPTPLCGALGLSIKNNAGTPNTQIDIAYSSAVMINPTGNVPFYGTNGSFTVNLTNGTGTSAANGMDGETRATSGWNNLFLISDGTNLAGLASLATGNNLTPTMPAGYIYRCYVGAMRGDGSANLLRTVQKGARAQYTATSSVAGYQLIASGSSGSVTTPTWTSFAVGAYAPPTATQIVTVLGQNNGQDMAAPNGNYGPQTSTSSPPPCTNQTASATNLMCPLLLESTNIFYAANSAGSFLAAQGWVDNVNAN